jgi:23S rRNA-/tRNA-specific pseudouridylate synthase
VSKSPMISNENQDKKDLVLMDLEIITWRTHQIRYQLAEIGLPIVGDGLYGSAHGVLKLTAYKLEFVDLNGEKVVVII